MIIQNSKRLLEELSLLESQIKHIESIIHKVAPEYDSEEILKAVLKSYNKK